MDRKAAEVKTNRSYDGSGRRAQAERTRLNVLATARRLFLAGDYGSTTVAAIAGEAGVSVETIYKSFGGKSGLVRAIRAQALRGTGSEPAEQRSDLLQVTEPDPGAIIRGWAVLTMEVSPRVAPVLLLVRDAAVSDPEMARLRAELDEARMERMTHNAATLADGGHLRADVSLEHAAGVLWTYSSPELYELLVSTRRWNLQQYADFIAQAMIGALLA